jgi:hypothetical protein
MSIETFLVKRAAHYRGEVGLFPNSQMAEEDIALFAMNTELMAKLWSEKRIEALRYLWGLVHKTADNCDLFVDKDDAMEALKIRAGYSKAVYDPRTRKIEPRAKSLTRISDERLRLLTAKIQDLITTEILPGIRNDTLRHEIEELISARAA